MVTGFVSVNEKKSFNSNTSRQIIRIKHQVEIKII